MSAGTYDDLLDAEIRAFIARSSSFYPPDATNLTVPDQRAVYDALCRDFHAGRPGGVAVTDTTFSHDGIETPLRLYDPQSRHPTAQLVYFHGGGFVVGGLDSHDDTCAEMSARTGFPLMSVDYRLAPEHPYPAAFDDAVAALRHAAATSPLPIVVAGDSAGANLAAAAAHAARGTGILLAGQVLIYPLLGSDTTGGSFADHAGAPMLTTADVAYYARIYNSNGVGGNDDPGLFPLNDTDFTGLPPTVCVAAQCDPLADDSPRYAEAIRNAGGKAVAFVEPGLVHGFLRARTMSHRARDAFTRIVDAAAALGKGDWPYSA